MQPMQVRPAALAGSLLHCKPKFKEKKGFKSFIRFRNIKVKELGQVNIFSDWRFGGH